MTLRRTGFNFFAKIIDENCVFYCSCRITFNSTSHLKNINFYTSNIIHLMTCKNCGTQYVREIANKLHIRLNPHKKGKTGCSLVNEHFSLSCKGKSYSIQIIEILSRNGHDETSIVGENIFTLRLVREVFWIKLLRTYFPYGLSKRSKYLTPRAPIGTKFYPIG